MNRTLSITLSLLALALATFIALAFSAPVSRPQTVSITPPPTNTPIGEDTEPPEGAP